MSSEPVTATCKHFRSNNMLRKHLFRVGQRVSTYLDGCYVLGFILDFDGHNYRGEPQYLVSLKDGETTAVRPEYHLHDYDGKK